MQFQNASPASSRFWWIALVKVSIDAYLIHICTCKTEIKTDVTDHDFLFLSPIDLSLILKYVQVLIETSFYCHFVNWLLQGSIRMNIHFCKK